MCSALVGGNSSFCCVNLLNKTNTTCSGTNWIGSIIRSVLWIHQSSLHFENAFDLQMKNQNRSVFRECGKSLFVVFFSVYTVDGSSFPQLVHYIQAVVVQKIANKIWNCWMTRVETDFFTTSTMWEKSKPENMSKGK